MLAGKWFSMVVLILAVVFCGLVIWGDDVEKIAVINGMPVILADPASVVDWYDAQAAYNLYSTLVYPTAAGKLRPHLALDWEAVDGDLSVWRFSLRQGVKFHDGSEVRAEDVAFSMERFMALEKGFSGTLGKVLSTTIVGEYEVVFELEASSRVFPETLVNFWVLNKDLVLKNIQPGEHGENGDYGEEWLTTHDAGSGPYVMTSHEVGDSLTAERFEDYFLGWDSFGPNSEPIDKLLFRMVTEPGTALVLMKARQLDVGTNWWAKETMDQLAATEGIDIKYFPPEVIPIWLNTRRSPTDDIHFRRAMAYAFDYDAIRGQFPSSDLGAPIISAFPGYKEDLALPYRDLDKAKQELALSKYAPDEVAVTINWVTGVEAEARIILQLQANLAEIGIKAEISPLPWTKLAADVANAELAPHGSIFMFPPVYPSADFFLHYMYHPQLTGGVYAGHWLADEQLGALIDQSRVASDYEEMIRLYEQIQERVVSLVLAIYAVEAPQPHPIQDYLIGPREIYPMVGPNIDMHNYRIDMQRKQELLGK